MALQARRLEMHKLCSGLYIHISSTFGVPDPTSVTPIILPALMSSSLNWEILDWNQAHPSTLSTASLVLDSSLAIRSRQPVNKSRRTTKSHLQATKSFNLNPCRTSIRTPHLAKITRARACASKRIATVGRHGAVEGKRLRAHCARDHT